MTLEKTMLEYVLERDSTNKYANFLNLNLKTEMFVPCDDEGNVLDEPKPFYEGSNPYEDYEPKYDLKECEIYKKALSKVLFEGFYYMKMSKQHALYNETGIFASGVNLDCIFNGKTIESILTKKLTLTPAGQKLAGLI